MSHKPKFDIRSSHGQGGGDSERLSDQIFSSTGVQAKVFCKDGAVKLTVETDADWYVARDFLVNGRGFRKEKVVRQQDLETKP